MKNISAFSWSSNWSSILGFLLALIQLGVAIFAKPTDNEALIVFKLLIIVVSILIVIFSAISLLRNARRVIAIIGYDYLPFSPLNNGWQIPDDKNRNANFSFNFREITINNLRGISFNNVYDLPIDLNFTQNIGIAKKIEFYLQLQNKAAVYLHILAESIQSKSPKDYWVRLEIGKGTNYNVSTNEVNYHISGKNVNGYEKLNIDIDKITKECFPNKGLKLNKILGIRLRGELGISQIKLMK
jgi:hypothetical protein